MKKVTFKNPRGQKLVGVINKPKGKNPPAVVMVHGVSTDKDQNGVFVEFANRLESAGYLVLRFDCAGSGESEGLARDMTRKTEAEDLISAIKYAKTLDINTKQVAVVGFSLGAGVATIAWNKDIKTMILISPSLDGTTIYKRYNTPEYQKQLKEKGYFTKVRSWGTYEIGKEFMDESKNLDIINVVKAINVPVLLIHGMEDSVVRLDRTKKFSKMFQKSKLVLVEGADHNIKNPKKQKEVIRVIEDWFNRYLK